jgi:hypothetical protein
MQVERAGFKREVKVIYMNRRSAPAAFGREKERAAGWAALSRCHPVGSVIAAGLRLIAAWPAGTAGRCIGRASQRDQKRTAKDQSFHVMVSVEDWIECLDPSLDQVRGGGKAG